jgi:iron complex transport system substrate-binding protein
VAHVVVAAATSERGDMTRTRGRRGSGATVFALALLVAAACGTGAADDLPGASPSADGSGSIDASETSDAPAVDASSTSNVPTVPDEPEPVLPVTVTSADGRTVTVDDVSRIVPLQGSLAEIVFALGLGDRVVGRDITATFPEAADLPVVTRAHDVSAESVLSLRPTLVLVDGDTGPPEAIDHIRNAGVPVVELAHATRVEEIGPRIEAMAEVLGVPEAGQALAARTDADIAAARAQAPEAGDLRVAFLYLRGTAGVYLIGGPGSGADSMIAAAGAVDAGTAMGLDRAFTPITSEALAMAAPDAILMTTTGLESVGGIDGLVEIAGIAQTPAGRDRRVVTVEDGLLYSFGTRTPEAIESIVAQLHADR